ncbi:hypothetical protein A2415_01605 [candidate division WWE3 bacterium RIFOXYC1_FULL_39_7]|uniref:Protein kinase domain-containing protein n=2 Tax=Katanobacteria TaxID=422282 RepID=A0A1F4X541_UNCKA|nr:MAG: hypothetical protein A2415_01605 [candidate division WWE3 bacterium RIFOXYC1_FULL_39_7]OGC76795.1 MAG: hypothetical protein A2619_00530 [candidate division WWE3 bacterium RIFOXYD1_FULL_39_9]
MIGNVNGYTVKEEWFIDKGTFGAVYKAFKDDVFYAIKVFQSDYVISDYGKDRVLREIKALQKIDHPNVVKIHDFGIFTEHGFEYYYLIMDFVDGSTLGELVGQLRETESMRIIKSVLETLEKVHEVAIHRDLKPQNIKIKKDGTPIILDFGLAKLIDYSSITQTGERLGSYAYMSPEQVTDSKNVDARSDFYSIGVIFYELVTGTSPYDAVNLPALIEQIKNRYPTPPSELNPEISYKTETLILKLLEKEPYKRYQSIKEIISVINTDIKPRRGLLDIESTYFVRLLHNEKTVILEAIDKGLASNLIFPAHFFAKQHPTVKELSERKIRLITDPSTNRMNYTAFTKTLSVRQLPYAPEDKVTPYQKKDFQSIEQIKTFVRNVLKYQIENSNTELVAPFFYAKDADDEWFSINLRLLRESLNIRDELYPDVPLWASICMSIEKWYAEDTRKYILNNYVRWAPDGFLIYPDKIDNNTSISQLYHYTKLLLELQKYADRPVVACRSNTFGLILLAAGIKGIGSGMSALDSFSEDLLTSDEEDYSVGTRYYYPELMTMIWLEKNLPTRLIDIYKSSLGEELKCNCPYCKPLYDKGELPRSNVKLHFLYRKFQELEQIRNLTEKEQRLEYLENRTKKALGYLKELRDKEIKVVSSYAHLNTWLELIDKLKNLSI